MRQKLLVFEYLLAIFFSFQILFPHLFPRHITITIFLSLLFLKSKYEGLRLTVLIFVAIQAGLLLYSNPVTNMLFTLMAYLTLTYFPVFEFPETKGPFLVGYKDLKVQKTIQVSVFYPTLQKTTKGLYKTSEDGWVRIYDIMRSYPGHFIPKFIYKVAFEFMEHLDIGVNLNARLISPQLLGQTNKFPVIVFSHGLSANRNLYTGFARQWASYGYIVLCIDHEEDIYLQFNGWDNFREQRKVHLDARCESISHVIDFLQDAKQIKKFFQSSTVELDFDRLSLGGHSFGSAAITEYSARDSRVTGALVLLDPWLFPASDEALSTPAKKPVLVIRTETFASLIEEFKVKEKIEAVVKANKEYSDETLSCYFKNTTHNSFCDLIVHMPREMKLFGIIDSPKVVEDIYNSQTMLSQIFLDLMLYSNRETEFDSKKALVLKAFESYSSVAGAKSQLEVDLF